MPVPAPSQSRREKRPLSGAVSTETSCPFFCRASEVANHRLFGILHGFLCKCRPTYGSRAAPERRRGSLPPPCGARRRESTCGCGGVMEQNVSWPRTSAARKDPRKPGLRRCCLLQTLVQLWYECIIPMGAASCRTSRNGLFSLPAEQAAFIDAKGSSGAYASASEVVRAGLRALQERDAAVERWLREEVAGLRRDEG